MFTEPASESAGVEGVGTLASSMREMSLRPMLRTSTLRVELTQMFEAGAPSEVIEVIPPPIPRTEMPATSMLS